MPQDLNAKPENLPSHSTKRLTTATAERLSPPSRKKSSSDCGGVIPKTSAHTDAQTLSGLFVIDQSLKPAKLA